MDPNVPVSPAEAPFAKAPARQAAAKAIGSLNDPAAAVVLAVKLRYPRGEVPEVLAECIEAAATLRPPRLLDMIGPYLEGRDSSLAAAAAAALADHLGKEALPILRDSFDRVPAGARVPLIYALTGIRSDQTGELLLGFLDDPDPAPRRQFLTPTIS